MVVCDDNPFSIVPCPHAPLLHRIFLHLYLDTTPMHWSEWKNEMVLNKSLRESLFCRHWLAKRQTSVLDAESGLLRKICHTSQNYRFHVLPSYHVRIFLYHTPKALDFL